MFESVLIANRGEIACRIIRTCRDLGIRTIAVYSEVDRDAHHVLLADEAWLIGPAPASESYLVWDRILAVAQSAKASAIHPGYGFLSENPDFQRACVSAGVVFIGPDAEAMIAMGEKTLARKTMVAAGVPVVPGTEALAIGDVAAAAEEIGYPVMLKAASGGGGKGMQVVHDPADIVEAFESAERTARSAFGDERVYLEKLVANPRHVEIQVLADAHGAAVHLFERECSVQRRHQKIIEEAPASRLSDETRQAMGAIAVQAAKAIGYTNAGTCEFLVDAEERFYFLEMNTRLQVEHPVTECITGVDLVEEQLHIAAGEALRMSQEDLTIHGHAVECRLYAEDPDQGFLPSPGSIEALRFPEGPGVRVDAGVHLGSRVSEHYDPMIAKIIVHGRDRASAIRRAIRALGECHVGGIRTNLSLLRRVLTHPPFAEGRYDTGILETLADAPDLDPELRGLIAAAGAMFADEAELRRQAPPEHPAPSGWRVAGRQARLQARVRRS